MNHFDVPGAAKIIGAVAIAALVAPLVALIVSTTPGAFVSALTRASSLDALWLTAKTTACTVALCVFFGIPAALLAARLQGVLGRIFRAVITVPMVLPPVVAGVALLYLFGARGLLGASLAQWGLTVVFTQSAVVLAQTFVAFPFFVLTLSAGLAQPRDAAAQAALLGATPFRVFLTVTLPAARRALLAATLLAAARATGEFGATMAFAGSMQGVTRTLPLEIYLQREADPAAAIALSVVLLAFAVAVLVSTPQSARSEERE